MSAEAMIWSRKLLPLLANDSQRVVLLDFAWRASPDGLLWPSIADVSMELGKSPRAIRRTLHELDQEAVLNVSSDFRNDGSQGSNYYQLLLSVTPQDLLKRRKGGAGTKGGVEGSAIMSTYRKRFEQRMMRFYDQVQCWGQALTFIRNEIVDKRTFDTWYTPLKFKGINRRSLILGVPNEQFEDYFRDGRCRKILLTAAKQSFPSVDLVGVYFRSQK